MERRLNLQLEVEMKAKSMYAILQRLTISEMQFLTTEKTHKGIHEFKKKGKGKEVTCKIEQQKEHNKQPQVPTACMNYKLKL